MLLNENKLRSLYNTELLDLCFAPNCNFKNSSNNRHDYSENLSNCYIIIFVSLPISTILVILAR